MDVFEIDGAKDAFWGLLWGLLGMLGVGGVQVAKGMVMAQRDRDKDVAALKDNFAAFKLSVSDGYAKKTEISRLHDRIDNMDKKVDDIHAILIDLPQQLATMVKK